jgi:helicase MOV-10
MERISEIKELYEHDSNVLNANYCIELVLNYRSHPKILEFSSKQFYGQRLKCAVPGNFKASSTWKWLPNAECPFVFYGIEGEDLQEADSPSFFNRMEASAVADMIQDLLKSKLATANEVGVITAYYKQV